MGRAVRMTDALEDYLARFGAREHPAQVRCREETAALPMAMMQISPEQGAFMGLVTKLIGAKRYLEIGTFTGYSALSVVLAMPADGRAVALDVSREYTDRARQYWKDADVASRIDLRIAPALQSLEAMTAAGELPFDLAFIDADKTNYGAYYERCLTLVRPGGLIMLDNMLWSGSVADPAITDESTNAIRALNEKIHADTRVDVALTAIGDGIMLARRR